MKFATQLFASLCTWQVQKEDYDWEYVEDGPAEIIWQGNEIIVKKKRVKVPKKKLNNSKEVSTI